MALAKEAMTGGGSKLSVSAALPATWNKVGFEALTWTQIGNLVNLGELGKTYNTTNFEPVSNPEIESLPTNYSMGTPAVTYAYPREAGYDDGQAIMDAAVDSQDYHSFKVEMQNGTVKYFKARVSSNSLMLGGVSDIQMVTANLQIYTADQGFVTVAPTP